MKRKLKQKKRLACSQATPFAMRLPNDLVTQKIEPILISSLNETKHG
jgi:hypothetical protein